jgi:chemotaxis protein MotA
MLFIIGMIVVFGSIVMGYTMHGGKLYVLWQPSEYIIIGGAAIGAFLIANPPHVLKAAGGGLKVVLAGLPYTKKATFMQVLGFFFELSKLMRTKGIKEVEQHIDHPHDSALFQKYPALSKDHHIESFICDNIRLIVMGSGLPNQLDELMDEEIHIHHNERHAVVNAFNTMGDGMPALGIVAAVLGVIVTMGSITEPPEILGKLIGAALVGTFFGVLMSYGLIGPMAKSMEAQYAGEHAFYLCLKVAIVNFARQLSPQIICEFTRKQMPGLVRPTFQEAEEYLNKIGAGASAGSGA